MNRAYLLFTLLVLAFFTRCERQDLRPNAPGDLGSFIVSVSNRLATSADLNWTIATNSNNNDSVKYRIVLNGNQIADNLFTTSFTVTNLNADSLYNGRVYAYTVSGDISSAPFNIERFVTPPPAYSYVTGFYRVTETTTTFTTGSFISNFTFVGKATLINDSTILFEQNRRIPKTWWATDFQQRIYPGLNDSLMLMGTSPAGRILNPSTIRMGYLFGSTIVYDVKQMWTKLDNPADTSTIVYVYPNVPTMTTTVAGNNVSGAGYKAR
ncbi:MAG: fibronectin type III domain-containing protein [Ferruginibacter sp.]|nr:fibronectin type III domain-containing protein [Ferruginibacter sp.]